MRLVDLLEDSELVGEPPGTPGGKSGNDLDRKLLRTFVGRIEEACDEEYRQLHGEAQLVRQLTDTFRFIQQRKRHEILVRVLLQPRSGGDEDATLLEVAVPDQPFIIDTIQLFLDFVGLSVISSFYVSGPVIRDRGGRITALESTDRAAVRETLACFELRGALTEEFRSTIEHFPKVSKASIPALIKKLPNTRRPWSTPFETEADSSGSICLRFEFTDASDRWDFIAEGGKTRMEPSGSGPADLIMASDSSAFVLLTYGRLTLESTVAAGLFTVEGELQLIPDIDRWLAGA